MELLLIETNENIKDLIQNRLKDDFDIEVTSLGEEGLELAKTYDYNVIILGRMLADSDGYQVLRQLRAQQVISPILFLCGLNSADLKVKALREGADDCMSIPFNVDEFVERVRLLIRHRNGHRGTRIHVGRLSILPDQFKVLVDDVPLKISGKEYDVLEFLCSHKNKVITQAQILDHLYLHEQPKLKVVCIWINFLRKKLKAALGDPLIKNVWGRGYMVSDPD